MNGGMRMKIGFIGAGKVGFSLGRYLIDHEYMIIGYYSKSPDSAREAALFTGTKAYLSLEAIVSDCDILFLTVPDDQIVLVWDQIKNFQIVGKIICHCSGVLSSEIFSDMTRTGSYGYSIHPFLAVNSKLHTYQELPKALFTIEGSVERKTEMEMLFRKCGNTVVTLTPQDKVRYHAAAVMASNLVLGLIETAIEELSLCGFSRDEAQAVLVPLISGNVSHLQECSIENSLTGPIERGDTETVILHLNVLDNINREIYRLLSIKTLQIANRKNPIRDYKKMEELFEDGQEHCS